MHLFIGKNICRGEKRNVYENVLRNKKYANCVVTLHAYILRC